ncbi:hypothetical protein PPERSA_12778 [Pseudocohnilembus persalinus]|uniref:Uncharacterized protein n=1 Tax=Pseudocohnilembus persalinus TaxID=266149 RepID=A0A0V0QUF0_PSEPJ|nr:hypothetical protein PPERSA_12778 [Pseudocohnilembus persalinus]|eukprot:KRX05600.1 hypothetical protein PPERSA_12778 [Pseudocohnilembus persalinus]
MSYHQVTFNGKTYWTHSSFVANEKQTAIQQLQKGVKPVQNGATAMTLIGSLFVANKVGLVSRLPLVHRTAAVLVPTLLARFLSPTVYNSGITSDINQQLDGAPLWENKFDVPELDKLYFFLDDDNNYKPNLWYHGLAVPKKYDALYKH